MRALRAWRLNRYLVEEFASPFLGAAIAFAFLFLVMQLLKLAEFLIQRKVPALVVAEIAGYLTLSFAHFVVPVAFLAAMIVGSARLCADRELTALRALGMGRGRLIGTGLLLSVLACGLSAAIVFNLAPWGERSLLSTMNRVGSRHAASAIESKRFNRDFYGLVLYTDEVDPGTGVMHRVFLVDERDPKLPLVIAAKEGVLRRVKDPDPLSMRARLELTDGTLHKNFEGTGAEQLRFQRYSVYLRSLSTAGAEQELPRTLGLRELTRRWLDPQLRPHVQGELWKRVAVAWSPLVFVLLGIALGTLKEGGRIDLSPSRGYLITIAVAAGYWMLLGMGKSMADSGWVPYGIGLHLANFVGGGLGAGLLWRMRG